MDVTPLEPLPMGLPTPPVHCRHYTTRFGGERSDVVEIQLQYTPTLANPGRFFLKDVLKKGLPQLEEKQWRELLDLGSIYVTKIQLGSAEESEQKNHTSLENIPSQKTKRYMKRYANRVKQYHGEFSPRAPRLTHRLMYAPSEADPLLILPKATVALRVHLVPQRFPLSPYIHWSSRVLVCDAELVVVDKPGGIPCQPVASNYQECVHVLAGKELFQHPLFPTFRVDLWTTGLVCLARTPAVAHKVNDWQRRNLLKKTYRALCYDASVHPFFSKKNITLPYRLHHWMPKGPLLGLTSPRLLSTQEIPTWKPCTSLLLSFSPHHFSPNFTVLPNEAQNLGYHEKMTQEIHRLRSLKYQFYDVHLQLITGRTHQLRAQLSALGFPIVGDTLYYPLVNVDLNNFCPQRLTQQLDFSSCIQRPHDKYTGDPLTPPEEALLQCYRETKTPTYPLGLQAHSLEFLHTHPSVKVVLDAPWWLHGRH